MMKPNFVTRENFNPFFRQCNKPRGLIIDTNFFFYLICDDLSISRPAHRRERILDNLKVGKILYWKRKLIKTFATFLIQKLQFLTSPFSLRFNTFFQCTFINIGHSAKRLELNVNRR